MNFSSVSLAESALGFLFQHDGIRADQVGERAEIVALVHPIFARRQHSAAICGGVDLDQHHGDAPGSLRENFQHRLALFRCDFQIQLPFSMRLGNAAEPSV